MNRSLRKDTFREIGKTKNRFFSIFAIIAIGVGFFAGVKASCSDMKRSNDVFTDRSNFMHVRVLSTLGFSETDVSALKKVEGVSAVSPGYQVDLILEKKSSESVCKIFSLPDQTDSPINQLVVEEGNLPQTDTECVVDKSLIEANDLHLGDTIRLKASADAPGTVDSLKYREYTISGFVSSPSYLYKMQRGNATIGNGIADGFVYLPKQAFDLSAYTEVYLTFDDLKAAEAYTKEYEETEKIHLDVIEQVGEDRKPIRLEEVKQQASEEITENEQALTDARQEQTTQLADAEQKLQDAKTKLDKGEAEYQKNHQLFIDGIAHGTSQLETAKQGIHDGWKNYHDGQAALQSAINDLNNKREELKATNMLLIDTKNKLDAFKQQLDENEETLRQNQADLNTAKDSYQASKSLYTMLQQAIKDPSSFDRDHLADMKTWLDSTQSGLGSLFESYLNGNTSVLSPLKYAAEQIRTALDSAKKNIDETQTHLDKADQQLIKKRGEYDISFTEYTAGKKAYDDGMAAFSAAQEEIDRQSVLLFETKNMLSTSEAELKKQETALASKKSEGEKQLAEARAKLDQGERDYQNGITELQEKKTESDAKLKEAEEKLEQAKADVAKLALPTWYVLGRNDAFPGYESFGLDAERVDSVAKVFPVFFLLVAALVCLTTMTRMIEEQRTQIGTMKALGYSDTAIMTKYMIYGLTACLTGGIVGLIIGFQVFPRIVMYAYSIMYEIPVVVAPFRFDLAIPSMAAALICVALTIFIVCRGELSQKPSQLMRPKSPKPGKRVLLEKIPFIWNHFNFSHKVTARNLFRYKQRIFMTVIGIAGCTALMLTGFALKDSITAVVDKQFTEISLYDMVVAPKEHAADQTVQVLSDCDLIGPIGEFYNESSTAVSGEKQMDITLYVPQQTDAFSTFISLHDRKTKTPIPLTDDGVVITEKMAKDLGVKVGDLLTVRDADYRSIEAKITGIAENYTQHYVYMTAPLYEQLYGDSPNYNVVFAGWKDDANTDLDLVFQELTNHDAMQGINFLSTMRDTFDDMIKSLNYVVLVLIVSAGLLAFVVLYNLTNINVTERIREIATLKVLGFYDKEVSAYIYRENIILTILGTVVGLFCGILLSQFVISTAEMDMVMFGREIHLWSFVISAALTLLFAFLVNFVMHQKLKKIQMVESLKSIE